MWTRCTRMCGRRWVRKPKPSNAGETGDPFINNQVPVYTVKRQAKPVFASGASGQQITLSGTAGVLVTVHSASESASYNGATDFSQAGFPVLKEARLTQDFEGTVTWGLGLGSAACMRVFTLVGPSRLVIDFATTSG